MKKRQTKRIISIILLAVMLLIVLPMGIFSESATGGTFTPDTNWDTDTDVAYLITSSEELAGMASKVCNSSTSANYNGVDFKLMREGLTVCGKLCSCGVGT